jgi:hypothetical protein
MPPFCAPAVEAPEPPLTGAFAMRRPGTLAPRLAAVLSLTAAPGAALACSPAPGYHVPTNFELAEAANLVVLGEVVSGGQGVALDPDAATITVHPLATLKGLTPGADIALAGMSLARPGDAAAGQTSEPLAFGDSHPQALTGACIRRVFPLGAKALFFLRRENGQWVPAGGPFSRWAEDVAGPEAPWAQLAALYAQASLLPPEQAREMIETEHAALVGRPDDPRAVATAADLERSLAAPPPPLIAAPPAAPETAVVEPAPESAAEPDAVERAIDAFGD